MARTKIYIANLGKYNEGKLVGEWIDLPFIEEELEELFVRIGLGYFDEQGNYTHGLEVDGVVYEEYAIHDFDTDIPGLKIDEYADIYAVNEMIEAYEELDDHEKDIVAAALECFGDDLMDIINSVDSYMLFPDVQDDYDLGYYYAVESGYLKEDSPLSNYIDYEAYGRDIRICTDGGFTSKGWIERA